MNQLGTEVGSTRVIRARFVSVTCVHLFEPEKVACFLRLKLVIKADTQIFNFETKKPPPLQHGVHIDLVQNAAVFS